MAPVETHTILVHNGAFDEESRKYPVFDFFEKYVTWFDDREHDSAGLEDFHTADFVFTTPHSDLLESSADEHGYSDDHALKRGAAKLYTDPLTDHKQFTKVFYAIENPNGWAASSRNIIYADVAGNPVEGEKKVKDPEGREWDVEIPVCYDAELVKDSSAKHQGLKFKWITVIKDTGVVNDKLDARGVGHKRSIN